jgi:hypothetical protein
MDGTIYCQDHAPVPAYTAADPGFASANPYLNQTSLPPPVSAPVRVSPGLAWFLGLIPGVGAIYNGQYLKGLVHALITGLLITLISAAEPSAAVQPMLALLLTAFWIYMPFEAYHTAKRRQSGVPVDEWSSIVPRRRGGTCIPVGPIVLIIIGVLYLLNTLDLINFAQVARFWPVILIVAGAYMLYNRVTGAEPPHSAASTPSDFTRNNDFLEQRHER